MCWKLCDFLLFIQINIFFFTPSFLWSWNIWIITQFDRLFFPLFQLSVFHIFFFWIQEAICYFYMLSSLLHDYHFFLIVSHQKSFDCVFFKRGFSIIRNGPPTRPSVHIALFINLNCLIDFKFSGIIPRYDYSWYC